MMDTVICFLGVLVELTAGVDVFGDSEELQPAIVPTSMPEAAVISDIFFIVTSFLFI
jgi:hypothetical protein